MKKFLVLFVSFFTLNLVAAAQDFNFSGDYQYQVKQNQASITFENKSNCKMTLKVIKYYGGLYTSFVLPPKTSYTVRFSSTSTYKLKIKAHHPIRPSYHDGGEFSVTCNEREWTEGTMSFSLSSYGNGLGPSISASEFEQNE